MLINKIDDQILSGQNHDSRGFSNLLSTRVAALVIVVFVVLAATIYAASLLFSKLQPKKKPKYEQPVPPSLPIDEQVDGWEKMALAAQNRQGKLNKNEFDFIKKGNPDLLLLEPDLLSIPLTLSKESVDSAT